MPELEHDNHGRTPAAWTGVGIWCVTAVVAALVLIFVSVTACVVVLVVGTALGAIVWKIMGLSAARRSQGSIAEQQQAGQPAG
jgi:threonine/homoserine/homoserine lactone efflux protein